jgi:putative membrane protein
MNQVPRLQWGMLALVAIAVPISIYEALYPANTWLQVGPVGVGLLVAPWALRRWPLTNLAAGCVTAFILMHLFAATWSYSYVPYERWSLAFGTDIDKALGWNRNMFDRAVHFAFGLLSMPVCAEVLVRHAGASRRFALSFALLFVLGTSCLYEIFEWSLTMTLAPADAGAYNGEQGDPFDSQKDMAMAALGALLALPWARQCALKCEKT